MARSAPVERAPAPPPGHVLVKSGRGDNPRRQQVALARQVARELRENATYRETFGHGAPEADLVATALEDAAEWAASLANATAWFEYVRQEASASWRRATRLTGALRGPFVFSVEREAALAESLPSTAEFFRVPQAAAQKAAETKKKMRAAR